MAPEPTGGYRDATVPDPPRKAKVGALFKALAKMPGVQVKREGRRIDVRRKKPRALVVVEAQAKEVGAGEITMMLDEVILAASVARTIYDVLGPFEIEIDGVPIPIDRAASVVKIIQAWQQGLVARIRTRAG
jgi:hypothetical protein